jgi:glycosyltransferase involved in cell wall biosynthesis
LVQEFKKSDIEILVATMNRSSLDFLVPMFPGMHYFDFNILIINQTKEDAVALSEYPNVRVVNVYEKGLSKSRNLALENAIGRLCVITDDDVVFKQDFCDHVTTAFNDCPSSAVISFRVENAEGVLYKKYPSQRLTTTKLSNWLSIMSIEIVLNRETVRESSLKFNEHFGLGTQFCMGEEVLLLNEINNRGFGITMEPQVIAKHSGRDTHTRVNVWEKYYVQGALFTALFGDKYYLLLLSKLAHEIRRKKIKIKQVLVAVKAVVAGRAAFKNLYDDHTK